MFYATLQRRPIFRRHWHLRVDDSSSRVACALHALLAARPRVPFSGPPLSAYEADNDEAKKVMERDFHCSSSPPLLTIG